MQQKFFLYGLVKEWQCKRLRNTYWIFCIKNVLPMCNKFNFAATMRPFGVTNLSKKF